MNIQRTLNTNPKTVGTLRANMLAAREAVARRQDPPAAFRHTDVMDETEYVSDYVDYMAYKHEWSAETPIQDAARQMRASRNSDYQEAALRVTGLVGGSVALGLTGRLLSGASLLGGEVVKMSPMAGLAAAVATAALCWVTRPALAFEAYMTGRSKEEIASQMESWA